MTRAVAPQIPRRFVMPYREPRGLRWFRRVIIVAAGLQILIFCWSIYRRVWQVLRLDMSVSTQVLTPRSTVSYDVITTGEVRNRIVLELVQGSHVEKLMEERGRLSAVNSYDPRIFEYVRSVTITPELLSRFSPGPATLRLTGFGDQKLLRTPRPRVRELEVTLGR